MPRFFGDTQNGYSSNTGPNSGANSGNLPRALKYRNQYEKFGESNELYAMSGRSRSRTDGQMTVEIAAGRRRSEDVDDDRSDKAIMHNSDSKIVQIKTVTVQHEDQGV